LRDSNLATPPRRFFLRAVVPERRAAPAFGRIGVDLAACGAEPPRAAARPVRRACC